MRERRDHSSLRASDADRERVATLLRDHCAAGRLSFDELDERLGQAYAGRTYRDLLVLMTDLPRAGMPAVGAHPAQRPSSGRAAGAIFVWALAAMMLVPAVFAVVGAIAMAAVAMTLTGLLLAAPFVLVAAMLVWTIRRQAGRLGPPRRPRGSFPAR